MTDKSLTLYECSRIIDQIETIAMENEGVVPEDKLQELVVAQTASIEKLGKLCGFMKHLEHGIALCKQEEERIAKMRKSASNRLQSIKDYLLPYLVARGKPVTVGTFKLNTGKSEAVQVDEGYFFSANGHKVFCRHIPARWEPDKALIKAYIKDGVEIQGCSIEKRVSVQLK